ncbi:MoxR family ATPase [Candidatus Poseidonia alphae]|nr:MoxR family ATPase [Candidatus Poseidonia alphae]MDA8749635.1 MoxR family ATPase [Candidatus Poseidonia alphae]MDA8758825.1 MoxR family ATPase [Candidatus Poseidonia alphae]MDB2637121.1 MoxR family ATPase [Candidatus Poseidonia alphae]MDC0625717.1 MoxR family ATPase [Candidatus Poseidonia alphae]
MQPPAPPAAPPAPAPAAPVAPAAPPAPAMPMAPAAPAAPVAPAAPAAPAQPKHQSTPEVRERLKAVGAIATAIAAEVQKVIIGKAHVIDNVLVNILSNGNLLFEDYPGLAKTLMTNTFADALGCDFKRVQFTPDLLPADITGTNIYDAKKGEFTFKPGPLFCNLLLADEINRAPPKTQAALLEAMQEKQVTIGTVTHKLPAPFIVMATQNPVEQEGTYPLPEAQLDRFMFKMSVGYPDRADEDEILARRISRGKDAVDVDVITDPQRVIAMQQACEDVYVDPALRMYMVEIVSRTREDPRVLVGASPRGSQALLKTSRAAAALRGRDFVTPDDVKAISELALAHRIILKPEHQIKGLESGEVIQAILREVPVPTV